MEKEKSTVMSDLLKIAQIMLKKWWLILISTVVLGAVFLIRALFFLTPIYGSTAMVYVNNSNLSISDARISMSYADISASQSLVETYITILTSRVTLEEVIKEANVDYTYKELRKMISAEPMEDTEVFSISVYSENPAEACKIANAILKVLPGRITEIIDGTSARIVDTAVTDYLIVSPEYFKHLLAGMLLGFAIMSAFVVLRELMDDKIQSDEWIKNTFKEEFPLLSVIPDDKSLSSRYGRYYYRRYGNYYKYDSYGYGYGYGYSTKKKAADKDKKEG